MQQISGAAMCLDGKSAKDKYMRITPPQERAFCAS